MRDLEARANWLAARVDELLDSDWWREDKRCADLDEYLSESDYKELALEQAEREHAELMADLEEERINAAREY